MLSKQSCISLRKVEMKFLGSDDRTLFFDSLVNSSRNGA